MMITLFGISNCDTVRKARGWLDQQGLDHCFHDYRKKGCEQELIQKMLRHFNLDDLINRRGTTWRSLPKTIRESMDEKAAIALMRENPALIKRPIAQSGRLWLLGFNEAHWRSALLTKK